MKLLLSLSIAALLVSSAFAAVSLEEFVNDPTVMRAAPHLLEEISTSGVESYSNGPDLFPLTAGLKNPLLDDIIQVVSLNIFSGGDADWSRLEQAKLKAIQDHGSEAFAAATNLTEIDTQRAALIVNTVYDTVINLPPLSKESYAAKKSTAKKEDAKDNNEDAKDNKEDAKDSKEDAKDNKEDDNANPKQEDAEVEAPQEIEETEKQGGPSRLWDILGFGLIKSSNTIKMAKGVVSPSHVCETTDTAYLKGVDDVVYYSSLTHGLAGGALAASPPDSTVKSLDLQTIVHAIGRLAIEIQLAQSVARLADLNPSDHKVRTIAYLALTSESASSSHAQIARDINNLISMGIGKDIPEAVLQSLSDEAALQLITRGAGSSGSAPSVFNNIPIVRNLFAFSSEVLSANNIGDVLKYAFCPESSQATEPPKVEVGPGGFEEGGENTAEKAPETAQSVFRVPEEAVKNAVEGGKKKAQDTKDEGRVKAAEASADIKNRAQDAGARIQEKVAEETEKANIAGEKLAQHVKDTVAESKRMAEEARRVVDESIKAGKKRAAEEAEQAKSKGRDGARKVADQAADRADEIKQEL